MGRFLAWGLVAVVLVWWWMPDRLRPHQLPVMADGSRSGARTVGGPCLEGRCVVVYLAPWCGSCRQAEPMLRDLRDSLARDGIPVVVVAGMDKPANLETYARNLGYPVLLDEEGRFKRAAGVNAVPTFLVVNRRGEVTETVKGAYQDARVMRQKLGT
jgi:thiol-disulfide isomerase/thioredoxin